MVVVALSLMVNGAVVTAIMVGKPAVNTEVSR